MKIKGKEHIRHASGNEDEWVCLCDNRPADDGFFPCTESGDEMEPIVGRGWRGLYLCARCGRIIDQGTLEVIGVNPKPILLG